MAQTNQAAWLNEVKQNFVIGSADIGKPAKDEVLVRNHAIAINPVDHAQQSGSYPPGRLPRILGNDVAGEIIDVGEGVGQFRKGDRVLGHCTALNTDEAKHGGFQEYTVVPTVGCAAIPKDMKYEDACVLPLAISTAALGLFHREHLGLRLPRAEQRESPQGDAEAVLIWGGSSSVGSAAIQLAVAAGYTVITTSSPRNYLLCKSLGASEVFDRASLSIVGDLTSAMQRYKFAGAFDAISTRDTQLNVAQVLAQLGGGRIALTLPATPDMPATVNARMIFAAFILSQDKALGREIYGDFLPAALNDGRIKPAPSADVVGHGVEHIQAAVDKLRAGVSGSKVVVTL
ncbi:Zinc-binding alcohol dehydrogenase domain-containing protein cipB [Cladophialophora carrionii]|uniref:Zinc-binding alcohol dehydrogenase domain-containing protein cipB n=1 Tax=Cladophialophora carrionii TaxID=86049 RepID=A0A1C1CE47_9EURO|nr:Zinc-binding alcohol dehydrogenase domain-containing protein cipB [Cladophialophora carrionii]